MVTWLVLPGSSLALWNSLFSDLLCAVPSPYYTKRNHVSVVMNRFYHTIIVYRVHAKSVALFSAKEGCRGGCRLLNRAMAMSVGTRASNSMKVACHTCSSDHALLFVLQTHIVQVQLGSFVIHVIHRNG